MSMPSDLERLFKAIEAGDLNATREVVPEFIRPNEFRASNGQSALLHALYFGRKEILDYLLGFNPPLDIFEASALGHRESATELFRLDSAAEIFSHDGWTPLHLAAFFGHETVVGDLLGLGADPKFISRNNVANTPLHAAVVKGNSAIAEFLIQKGADVNARGAGGWTPLLLAIASANEPLALRLLDHQADPTIKNDAQETAFSLAEKKQFNNLLSALNKRKQV